MKITDVTLKLFKWEGLPEVSTHLVRRKPGEVHDLGLVTIHTDEGIEGHSFLGKQIEFASSDAASLIRYLKPVLIGEDPMNRERLFRAIWRRRRLSSIRAVGALDVALWDLVGKILGAPVWQILGGFREKVPVYCSSDHLPSPSAYAEEALKFKEMGWHGYKIHTHGPWQDHIRVCEAVRNAVGSDPSFKLMMDSIFLYDFPTALRVGRALEEMDYYWYEDPLGDQDIYNYVKLKQKLDIPIVATERPMAGFDSYAPWITAQATDYLRGDVAIKGGITTMMKTAHLAEAFGMNYEVHVGGNAINNIANLHVELAIANCEFHEIIMPYEGRHYGLTECPEVDAEGYIHAPNGPGLGLSVDHELIGRNLIAELK